MNKFLKITLYIIVVISVVYFGYKIFKNILGNRSVIVEKPISGNIRKTFPSLVFTTKNPEKGLSCSASLWVYIKDWNYKFMKEKVIFSKGGLKLSIGGVNNDIILEVPIYDNNINEKITFKEIPLQKWINITIVLDNRNLDLWVNGQLYYSKYLKNLPKINHEAQLVLGDDGGFDGYISRFYHYNYPISKDFIEKHFNSGPVSNLGAFNSYLIGFSKDRERDAGKRVEGSDSNEYCQK